jgi:hypothetical protein
MNELKLYMILLGCRPEGRLTEQHDIFFGIGENMTELKPAMKNFWKEAPCIHVDAWREVNSVDGHQISVLEKQIADPVKKEKQLFFINLGGYKPHEFDEFHYKFLVAADDNAEAVRVSKQTAFYRHTGFESAVSHIDDKYGVDVDDIFNIEEILAAQYKDRYALQIVGTDSREEDPMHLGYLKWERI